VTLQIAYFAWVRERMGVADETVDLPAGVTNVSSLVAWLAARDDAGALACAEPARIRAAIDGHMAGPGAVVPRGGEVALFPPVTGG
jgi:molybdopterin synthase sulfur carrier subunit